MTVNTIHQQICKKHNTNTKNTIQHVQSKTCQNYVSKSIQTD